MPLEKRGNVVLDGITFSTDPQVYEPTNWPKRQSVHPNIGGGVTIQDFGTFQRDNIVRLASGSAGFLDEATVISLHTRFRTKGVAFTLTDFRDNEFTVFILEFVPVPTFIADLYTYTMRLQVLTIQKLFGKVFTGD